MEQVHVETRAEWRNWLVQNHDKSSGIWLVFHRKHTGKPILAYDAAVEEALCFGWIDSTVRKLDDERYARKLTPRRPGSCWSELNKKRVGKLMKQGLMAGPGIARVREARKSGRWEEPDRPEIPSEILGELADALARNKKAGAFFDQLAPGYRRQFVGWIAAAKRRETKDRRVREAIALLEQSRKLGMK